MRQVSLLVLSLISCTVFALNLEIEASDTAFCEGDSVLLEASHGFSVYEWNTGQDGRIIYVSQGGLYVLEAEDTAGNTYRDSIYILMYTPNTLSYASAPDPPYLCDGDSVVIELSEGFVSYWWNTGHRHDRAVLYPHEDKTIVVEAVDSNGCEQRIEFMVYVDDCDSCDLLGPTELTRCGVDSVVLEAKSGYSNYEWNDGDTNRIKWVSESGWHEIEATNSHGYTCYDSVYVRLDSGKALHYYTNPHPAVICEGDSIVIELTSGFKHYWWNTGHHSDRVVLAPREDKTVVVEAEDSNGCEQRIEFTIEVKNCDSCDVIYEDHIQKCDKDSVALEAEHGYLAYHWSGGTTGRLKWVKETGWYTVEAKNSNGYWCVDSVYVELNEARELTAYTNPSPAEICIGDSVVIEVSGGFKAYWWSTGHRNHTQRVVVYPTSDTAIVIEAVDSNGCEGRVVVEIEVDSCTASLFKLNESPFIKMYPNPASNQLHIELDGLENIAHEDQLEIRDLNARLVFIAPIESTSLDLDVSHLTKTMYIIRIGPYYGRLLLMN